MSLSATLLSTTEDGQSFYVINKDMKYLLNYLLKNVSKEDIRPMLQCIHVTKNIFEVTNGFTIVQIVFKNEQSFFPEGNFMMKLLGGNNLLIKSFTSEKPFPDTRVIFKYEEIEMRGMSFDENILKGSKGFAEIAFSPFLMRNVLSLNDISKVKFYLSNLVLMHLLTYFDCEYDIYVCMMPMFQESNASYPFGKNNGAYFKVTDLPKE